MPAWALILIVVLAIVVIAAVAWGAAQQRRRKRLQEQFGPEYERTVQQRDSRREAESELEERQSRREALNIRPLSAAAQSRYADEWRGVQGRFVDDPSNAVRQAQSLVLAMLRERGYPMDDFEQRAADISVDHPVVVENYRAAYRISGMNDDGRAGTEDLRQAMVHYRTLFEELLEGPVSPGPDDRNDVSATS
jgi:FtsZ-interacting cell division protein ZipA